MTKSDIKALIEKEVKRQLAASPRIVPKEPLRKVKHLPITSNQPDTKENAARRRL